MGRLHLIAVGALLSCCLPALAALAADSKPDSPEEIKVNALRDPEVRKYAAIVAGLDAFDQHHGMAPKTETLRFKVSRGAAPPRRRCRRRASTATMGSAWPCRSTLRASSRCRAARPRSTPKANWS